MEDNKKSKKQLIKELNSLRRSNAKLVREKRLQPESDQDKAQLAHFLQERIKELTCLYGVSELIERYDNSYDEVLQGVANLLPPSWQYPAITCGRVIVEGKEYLSPNFKTSRWKQAVDIKVGGKKIGSVEVYYIKKKPIIDEGPFLKEERLLINAIAEHLSRAIERFRASQQLETERAALKNMNVVLREVLAKAQDEKEEIGMTIRANVDKIIMPIFYALENEVPQEQQGYVNLLKRNLEEITSPFTSKLSKAFMNLTPTEIQICNMIKNGLSTKEIARLRHISLATVNRHREHIRRKLEITNKDINLPTYLHNFMPE